jgi:hypothetical protein
MTFVVQTAAARQGANANGTNSRRLIEAEVSLSPPITWQGRAQRNWSRLQPMNCVVGVRLLRPAAIEVSCFAQIPRGQRRKLIPTDTPSQNVRVINSTCSTGTDPGVQWVGSVSDERKHHASAFNSAGRLADSCVEKFLQNSDAQANLAVIKKIPSNWEQGEYVQKGGWATQPGATSTDYHLARACAEKLTQAKTAAAQ